MPGLYLLSLLVVIACLVSVDYKYKLAFFYRPRQTAMLLGSLVLLFAIWDTTGIHQGIFFIGDTSLLTGLRLATNFPIEEIVFLIVLNYTSLLTWTFMKARGRHA